MQEWLRSHEANTSQEVDRSDLNPNSFVAQTSVGNNSFESQPMSVDSVADYYLSALSVTSKPHSLDTDTTGLNAQASGNPPFAGDAA